MSADAQGNEAEEVARIILSVSAVGYDQSSEERREMGHRAAEKVIAHLSRKGTPNINSFDAADAKRIARELREVTANYDIIGEAATFLDYLAIPK